MPCNTMHGSCENTEGGYDCKCKDGFLVGKKMKKTVNDKQIDFQECVNIDECATNAGWFQILKFREALEVMNFSTNGIDGQLQSDRSDKHNFETTKDDCDQTTTTCEDLTGDPEGGYKCRCKDHHTVPSGITMGKQRHCVPKTCPTGFTFDADSDNGCKDVNECTTNLHSKYHSFYFLQTLYFKL